MGIFDKLFGKKKRIDEKKSKEVVIDDKTETKCLKCGNDIRSSDDFTYVPSGISCYNCGKHNRSNTRYILEMIAEHGVFTFKCHCGTFIGVPSDVVCSHCKMNFCKDYQNIIDKYSTTHTIKSKTVREGACPECGIIGTASPVSMSFRCSKCHGYLGVNQESIDKRLGVHVVCPHCLDELKIPPTVWCPVCRRNLLSDAEEIIKDHNSSDKVEEKVFTIPIIEYNEYLPKISDLLDTTNIDLLYAKHKAYCASCGVQFTKEALQMISVASMIKEFGSQLTVRGPSRQGNDLRSGKCPNCGHSKMKIVVGLSERNL